jgi:hypothetical protein
MKLIKGLFLFTALFIGAVLIHYYLPQRDIVKVVDTEVKRMDINKGSPFWDRADAGTEERVSRDVRFISTVRPNGKTVVYRNEDTGWSFPFYLKFDSSDLSAKAADLRSEGPQGREQWVAVTHYGWRIRLFTIFPNATKIRAVKGPDVVLIPWFNIVFLLAIFALIFWVWRRVRRFKENRIDPIADKAAAQISAAADSVEDEMAETGGAIKRLFRKFFGTTKK